MQPGMRKITLRSAELIIEDKYEYIKTLIDTSFNVTIIVKDKITHKKFALKKKLFYAYCDDSTNFELAVDLITQHKLNHENIVKIHDFSVHQRNRTNYDIYIYTECMEVCLYSVLKSNQVLTDGHYQYFIFQLLRAVQYIHSSGYCHLRIKSKYILLNSDCTLKLSKGLFYNNFVL